MCVPWFQARDIAERLGAYVVSSILTLEKKENNVLGTVVCAWLKPEDHEFKACVGYRERFTSKVNTPT